LGLQAENLGADFSYNSFPPRRLRFSTWSAVRLRLPPQALVGSGWRASLWGGRLMSESGQQQPIQQGVQSGSS
jgi:hypothetical protein